jgi:hypothetical protein
MQLSPQEINEEKTVLGGVVTESFFFDYALDTSEVSGIRRSISNFP